MMLSNGELQGGQYATGYLQGVTSWLTVACPLLGVDPFLVLFS